MGYVVETADLARDEDSLARFWTQSVPWFTREEHVRRIGWYRRNPCGETKMFLIRWGGGSEVIGSVGVAPRTISADDRALLAGCAVDIAVDERHRTVQPALLLARAVAGRLSPEMPVIWAYPNEASRGVFMRAGFKDSGQGHTYVRVFDYSDRFRRRGLPSLASRLASNCLCFLKDSKLQATASQVVVSELKSSDAELAAFLQRTDLLSSVNIVRTPEYLHWVYEQSPYRKYVMLGIRSAPEAPLDAVAFCYSKNGVSTLDEFVCAPGRGAAGRLLSAVVRWARGQVTTELQVPVVNEGATWAECALRLGLSRKPWRRLLVLRDASLAPAFQICGPAALASLQE